MEKITNIPFSIKEKGNTIKSLSVVDCDSVTMCSGISPKHRDLAALIKLAPEMYNFIYDLSEMFCGEAGDAAEDINNIAQDANYFIQEFKTLKGGE